MVERRRGEIVEIDARYPMVVYYNYFIRLAISRSRRRRRPRRRRRRISNRAQARALRVHARMRTELATHCWSSSDSSLVTSDTRPRLPQLRARTDRETRERCTVAPPRPACQSVHAFDASQ